MSEQWLHDDPRITGAKKIAALIVENRKLEFDNARLREKKQSLETELVHFRAGRERDLQDLRADNARLREAIREVCTDYETRGVTENSTYYKILRNALKEGE